MLCRFHEVNKLCRAFFYGGYRQNRDGRKLGGGKGAAYMVRIKVRAGDLEKALKKATEKKIKEIVEAKKEDLDRQRRVAGTFGSPAILHRTNPFLRSGNDALLPSGSRFKKNG